MAWEVGASSDPPSLILPLPDSKGDVTITLQKSMTKPSEPPALLASAATKKFLQSTKASSSTTPVDPWTQADPWGGYRATTAPPRGTDRIQQLEDRFTTSRCNQYAKKLLELLKLLQISRPWKHVCKPRFWSQFVRYSSADQDMEDYQAITDDRLKRLESGITELQATSHKFEGWFNQMHHTDQVMSAQLEAVTQQVDQQGHRIEKINSGLVTQVGGLQAGLSSVQQHVSNGFTRMEALLEKRAKTS